MAASLALLCQDSSELWDHTGTCGHVPRCGWLVADASEVCVWDMDCGTENLRSQDRSLPHSPWELESYLAPVAAEARRVGSWARIRLWDRKGQGRRGTGSPTG